MTSFVVLTPSRGLVHSRVAEAVMGNIASASAAGHEFRGWRLTHDLPIPDCDERMAEAGLATGADLLWFVEEDTVPPSGALLASMDLLCDVDIAAVDYPVGAEGWDCINRKPDGTIRWCGLGSTLIAREVFERLPRPWFSTDLAYMWRGDDWAPMANPMPPEKRYGQQDIYFFMAAVQAGFRIGQVPRMIAAQAKVRAFGSEGSNVGFHRIELDDQIRRFQ